MKRKNIGFNHPKYLECPECNMAFHEDLVEGSPEETYRIFSVLDNKYITETSEATETYVRSTARQQLSGHLGQTHRLKGKAFKEIMDKALKEWNDSNKCFRCNNYERKKTGRFCKGFNLHILFLRTDEHNCKHFEED